METGFTMQLTSPLKISDIFMKEKCEKPDPVTESDLISSGAKSDEKNRIKGKAFIDAR